MFLNRKFYLLSMLLGVTLSGCATSTYAPVCKAADWEKLGFQYATGAKSAEPLSFYNNVCPGFGYQVDKAAFNRGVAAGQGEICQVVEAFDYGYRNHGQSNVCESNSPSGYVEAYDAGHAVYELEQDLKSLDEREVYLERRSRWISNRVLHNGGSPTGGFANEGRSDTQARIVDLKAELDALRQMRDEKKARIRELKKLYD